MRRKYWYIAQPYLRLFCFVLFQLILQKSYCVWWFYVPKSFLLNTDKQNQIQGILTVNYLVFWNIMRSSLVIVGTSRSRKGMLRNWENIDISMNVYVVCHSTSPVWALGQHVLHAHAWVPKTHCSFSKIHIILALVLLLCATSLQCSDSGQMIFTLAIQEPIVQFDLHYFNG